MKELILGGVRSGKSRLAEQHAQDTGLPVTYIATATSEDDEMRARIEHHQAQRPGHWQLVEEPLGLATTLQQHAAANHCHANGSKIIAANITHTAGTHHPRQQ
jgi:adenosylcobinamide kinase/adenosylcobinamide-phosphate guanylyltransferase